MPSDEENVRYLYMVLTNGGTPNIDLKKVGDELGLKSGATSKRWSRIKQAMNDSKALGPSAYQFLWLCVKHCTREKAPDWGEIATACNIPTAGAASKRYSRMKQAFDSGATAPEASPVKGKTDTNSATPKRKRGKAAGRDEVIKEEPINEGDVVVSTEDVAEDEKPRKRSRTTKKNTTTIKQQGADSGEKPKKQTRGAKKSTKVKQEVADEDNLDHDSSATTIRLDNGNINGKGLDTSPLVPDMDSTSEQEGTDNDKDGEQHFVDALEASNDTDDAQDHLSIVDFGSPEPEI